MNDWDETITSLAAPDAEASRQQAYLVVVRGDNVGEVVPFNGSSMVIGRGSGADLRVNDEGVSRFHCKLTQEADGIAVQDLGSRNGTYCNGERVQPGNRMLAEGDRLQIGTTFVVRFTYLESGPIQAPAPEATDPMKDALTSTGSRRYFMDRLEKDIGPAPNNQARIAVVLVHVDRFPEVAAANGTKVADEIEVAVAKYVREHIHSDDVLARLDRGDFALILKGATPGDTFMLAERMRKNTSKLDVDAEGKQLALTLSLGVASLNELKIVTAHDLLVAAGSALHRARSSGGNRVVHCTPDLIREPKNHTKV